LIFGFWERGRVKHLSIYVWLANIICWYDRIKYCKVSCLIMEENNGWKLLMDPLSFHELSMGVRRNMAKQRSTKQHLLGNYPLPETSMNKRNVKRRTTRSHIKENNINGHINNNLLLVTQLVLLLRVILQPKNNLFKNIVFQFG